MKQQQSLSPQTNMETKLLPPIDDDNETNSEMNNENSGNEIVIPVPGSGSGSGSGSSRLSSRNSSGGKGSFEKQINHL